MCLGVPMILSELDETSLNGVAELEGTRYEVNVSLIENPQVGDYVIVHAGYAIERLDREEADARLEMFAELAQVNAL